MIYVFISHASQDAALARKVSQLLRASTDLDADDIRCTSTDAHGLSVGSDFARSLRRDINDADVLLAIFSEHSIASRFVCFELGAAWGLKTPILPICAPGFEPSRIPSPFSSLQAIRWENSVGWSALLGEVKKHAEVELEKPHVLQEAIADLLRT